MKDFEIRELLVELDESDKDVSEWEAGFIDSVAFGDFPLSEKQIQAAESMLEKYKLI